MTGATDGQAKMDGNESLGLGSACRIPKPRRKWGRAVPNCQKPLPL